MYRLCRAWEPEPGVFDSLEPEPTEKKPGAGAAKNMPLLYRLLEDKSMRKLYICYSSLGKIVSFYQGWGAGAGRSPVFLAPWSRSRLKKNRSLLEDKKHKKIVLLFFVLL